MFTRCCHADTHSVLQSGVSDGDLHLDPWLNADGGLRGPVKKRILTHNGRRRLLDNRASGEYRIPFALRTEGDVQVSEVH